MAAQTTVTIALKTPCTAHSSGHFARQTLNVSLCVALDLAGSRWTGRVEAASDTRRKTVHDGVSAQD